MSDGKQWPIGIIASIIFIVLACAATIYVALMQPVQEDADMMMGYHTLNNNANDIIVAGIIFDKKYNLTYVGEGVSLEGSTLAYKITNKKGDFINDAKIEVILSRPITLDNQVTLSQAKINNGIYSFENIKVPLKGRWNILARVVIGNDFRHMNLKSETGAKSVYEYGLNKPMRNSGANN
ncbi:hypothetical protein JHD50_05810 [Sulfurimonas sp. MAG313]|nr:hypothetical protein [Sulfurimonas sp. MAG313]MDF1880824.1 hypothetical protein [Sulfurimonas sp. MAG313]